MIKLKKFAILVNVMAVILLTVQQTAESRFLNARAQTFNELDTPTEVYSIEPILIYPNTRETIYSERRNSLEDTEIIYVKLLHKKNCCLTVRSSEAKNDVSSMRELNNKDFFYVQFLGNGKFSQDRLKVYQTPPFYAINVYKTRNEFTQTEAML